MRHNRLKRRVATHPLHPASCRNPPDLHLPVIPTEEAGKTGHLDVAGWGIEDLSVRIVLIGFWSVLLADISEVGKRVDSARAACWPLELDSVMTYRTRLRLLEP